MTGRTVLAVTLLVVAAGCTTTREKIRAEIEPLTRRADAVVRKLELLEQEGGKVARRKEPEEPAVKPPDERETPERPPSSGAAEAKERLYGTWVSEEVPTKVGPTINTVTFRRDGTVKIDTRSTLPLLGRLRTTEGPFTVEGNTLSSDSIEGGTSVTYSFEGDVLVLRTKDDTVIRLHPA